MTAACTASPQPDQRIPLSKRLRDTTSSLHRRVERSGFVHDLIRGRANRHGYAIYLGNLQHVYDELERCIEVHRADPAVGLIAWPTLYRRQAISHDLRMMASGPLMQPPPLLTATMIYASRIAHAAARNPALLIAHSYTRYLGDLNGGRILRRLLHERLGIDGRCLTFFDYEGISDAASTASRYRKAIDDAGYITLDPDDVAREAAVAFRLHVYLSTSVARALGSAPTLPHCAALPRDVDQR